MYSVCVIRLIIRKENLAQQSFECIFLCSREKLEKVMFFFKTEKQKETNSFSFLPKNKKTETNSVSSKSSPWRTKNVMKKKSQQTRPLHPTTHRQPRTNLKAHPPRPNKIPTTKSQPSLFPSTPQKKKIPTRFLSLFFPPLPRALPPSLLSFSPLSPGKRGGRRSRSPPTAAAAAARSDQIPTTRPNSGPIRPPERPPSTHLPIDSDPQSSGRGAGRGGGIGLGFCGGLVYWIRWWRRRDASSASRRSTTRSARWGSPCGLDLIGLCWCDWFWCDSDGFVSVLGGRIAGAAAADRGSPAAQRHIGVA